MAKQIHIDQRSEIWLGNCLDPSHVATVMDGRKADLLFVDAPYSEKTHTGHKKGKVTADRASGFSQSHRPNMNQNQRAVRRYARELRGDARKDLEYAAWSAKEVQQFCEAWLPVTYGWAASITDSVLLSAWESALASDDRLVFAPLPFVEIGSRVRMTGDGPSSWTCWLVVSRPRRAPFSKWGALRGAYIGATDRHTGREGRILGGKSYPLMRELICDYSRPGDLVVDPCLGGGTTMAAALAEGRRCIGVEQDPGRAGRCVDLVAGARATGKQTALW